MDCSNKRSQIELSGHAEFLKYAKDTLKYVCEYTHTHTLSHTHTPSLTHSHVHTHTVFTLTEIHMHIWEDPAIIQNDTLNSGKMYSLMGSLI